MFDFELTVSGLNWESDWNGDEVGYPDSGVVGLYSRPGATGKQYFYIDMEEMTILDVWTDEEDL